MYSKFNTIRAAFNYLINLTEIVLEREPQKDLTEGLAL